MKTSLSKNYLLLLLPVMAWPLLYANRIIPFVPESLFGAIPRPDWWSFAITIFIIEWSIFLYIRGRLKASAFTWNDIGLDWSWFYRNRKWLIPYFLIFITGAIVMPGILYGDQIPDEGQIIPITAVRWTERLWFVFLSLTAGVCEEITFRGVGITYFSKVLGNRWIAALITSLCFVFIHGPFQGWTWFGQYYMVGFFFALGFILGKRRRLEILILVHFTFDAALAAFVP